MANASKPNILVIFGDDIGMWNVGAYTHGMMGHTPNIDRIGREGMLFTDHYGQPSCTAGRAAFIMGQLPIRTGMTTIGIPGSTRGIQKSDPTLAEVLKSQGYATAQFGKNHLGDRNEFLPTMHGFDEWFGNLYHLNAEEEPEELDYPGQKNPEYLKKFGPRGVLHAWATDKDDPTEDPKFGRVGKQKIENTGHAHAQAHGDLRLRSARAHARRGWTRMARATSPSSAGSTPPRSTSGRTRRRSTCRRRSTKGAPKKTSYRAKMIEHDEHVGALLKKLDDLGVADNTIVVYTTDNGNELMMWPDGGYAPFRGEKGTTWEGGVRVPCLIRWPGKIAPGSVSNGIQNHEDLFATLAAAAGLPNLKDELLKGYKMNGTNYKVHLDGYNNLAHWTGKSAKSARREIFYYDETDLMAMRIDAWKMHIGVKHEGSWWNEKYYPSVPYLFNLRMDPMEKMDPESHEWGYIGRKFLAAKLWAPTAAGRSSRRTSRRYGLSAVPGGGHTEPEEGARERPGHDGTPEPRW